MESDADVKTDMSDVTGYTFLVNGKTPQQNWAANFKAGDKVRLRFINASAMSFLMSEFQI